MIKKLLFCIVLLMLLSSCSFKNTESINLSSNDVTTYIPEKEVEKNIQAINTKDIPENDISNNNNVFSKGSFSETDIQKLFTMKKEHIEDSLGTDYEISLTGAEESFTAYTYKKHDISIFYMMNDNVDFVRCGQTINFFGIHIGMTFKEIKEVIPNAEIKKRTPESDPDIVYYTIECLMDNMLIRLNIENEDSPATSLAVYRY